MEQLALYREWRPQCFKDVVGQEHVCRTLRNAIVFGRLAHAYLFCGPRGTGKTSTARILAKAANCPNCRDGEPCNGCESCRSITAGSSFDVLEMDAASHRGIEEIRELRQKVGFAPTVGRYKFYIIDEVHMLTGEAFNALLKTLEEPPRHTVFVLATTEAHKVPATILSRCQRFDFRRLGRDLIAAHLERVAREKGWEAEPDALNLIAKRAGGALRDALGLLDQAASFGGGRVTAADVEALTGILGGEALQPILEAVYRGDVPFLLERLEGFLAGGYDPRQILYQLTDYTRENLFSTRRTGVETAWYGAVLRALAEADAEMKGSGRPDLVLELALLRLAGAGSAAKGSTTGREGEDVPTAAGRAPAAGDRPAREGGTAGGRPVPPMSQEKQGDAGKGRPPGRPPGGGSGNPAVRPRGASREDRGKGVEDGDPTALRRFLQGRFRKQPLMGQVLAAAEIRQVGRRVLIGAPPPFGILLQKEENRRSLQQALAEFDDGLELEVGENASFDKAPAPAETPEVPVRPTPAEGAGRREGGSGGEKAETGPAEAAGDPVIGVALSLFKGKLIKGREDDD